MDKETVSLVKEELEKVLPFHYTEVEFTFQLINNRVTFTCFYKTKWVDEWEQLVTSRNYEDREKRWVITEIIRHISNERNREQNDILSDVPTVHTMWNKLVLHYKKDGKTTVKLSRIVPRANCNRGDLWKPY